MNRVLRKAVHRASTSNGHCCVGWRRAVFDAGTAARLADALAPIADPERLAEVGDWLVRCDTAAEFLARVEPAVPS